MNKIIFYIVASTMTLLLSCESKTNQAVYSMPDKTSREIAIKRGEYLVNIMDCHSCHTPKIMTEKGPAPDINRLLSGYNPNVPLPKPISGNTGWILFAPDITAASGPWGTSYAANLTSDETGIGSWTFEQFRKAMTEGKYRGIEGTRPLMPPMPWQAYKSLKAEDLSAIYEYLQSTKPVKNIVPFYTPPGA